ncbi:MAG TPA: hypothetical protein VLW26_12305 [Steroidobacteraceae bacterium]|nr:hypothetical protein [Steroidobacteraceae bacterium]
MRMKALVSDLIEFERQLAILEKRGARDLYPELIKPCPPSGLTVH